MRAQDFAGKLGISVEQSLPTDHEAALYTYPDGHVVIRIPRKWNANSADSQRVMWHEIGHYVDRAGHFGGRSSFSSRIQYGVYSTENKDLLSRYRSVLQKNRKPIEVVVRFSWRGKTITSSEMMANPEIPADVKERARIAIKLKEAAFREKAEDYLAQSTEVFADGFAEYMMHPEKIRRADIGLALLFELASRDVVEKGKARGPVAHKILAKPVRKRRTKSRQDPDMLIRAVK